MLRRKSGPMIAIVAILTFIVPGTAFADTASAFLQKISGGWKGRGIMQTKPDSRPEAVICRFKSNLSANGRRISNNGVCAGAQARANVAGSISYNPSTRRFTGRMLATGNSDGRSSSSGTLSGNTLSLKTIRFDNRQTVISRGSIRITSLGDDKMLIESTETVAKTNKTFVSSRIELRRR